MNEKMAIEKLRVAVKVKHYSTKTFEAYASWVKQYILFLRVNEYGVDILPSVKIESFLTHIATTRNISPSTQNQAMNAFFD